MHEKRLLLCAAASPAAKKVCDYGVNMINIHTNTNGDKITCLTLSYYISNKRES
jgi:hypothetical protein